MLLYGSDMDETRTPLETNINWTVKFDKEDFIGKEALLKEKKEGIKERLVGFELLERAIPRHGYSIFRDNEKVGIVTSGTFSPTLQKSIGLGYVKADFAGSDNNDFHRSFSNRCPCGFVSSRSGIAGG